ncbi:type II toxin-antitoxin system Phd/YefM family antitoxin [Microcoleus sp. CAWBG58]|uniref:type II toxin-antitoxin system Phd/YefM family antitoxin n=1 Tax=Microcoleus sp. CAWBG58 TaxID=2841651 RepID=UPI0025F53D8E|nr:type II toxin-antitoxin system Phd/YefM family antitoxin [Microcoleus sp. CAWBG58]
MTEGFNAADRSSIAPTILPIALDNCQNSAVGAAAGAKLAIDSEGFFHLTVEEFCENAIAIVKRVMQKGDRFILQQAGKDLGAIVPETEFHKLDYLMETLKPSQFFPDEEAYYEDERGIHCIYPDELVEDIDNILADVKEFDELFGLLPTEEMGENIDIFISVAILMSVDRFWVPEYLIAEKSRLKML